MNILEFVLLVWTAIMVVAVAIDFVPEIWAEKRDARQAQWAKVREAEAMLMMAIEKRYQPKIENVIELKVVTLPKKQPAGGRHRLSAA